MAAKNGKPLNPMTDLFTTSCTVRSVLRTWIPCRHMKSWEQSSATAKSGCTSVSRRPKNKKPRRSIGLRSIRLASRLAFADSLAEWPLGKPCFNARLITRPPRRRQPSDRRQRTADSLHRPQISKDLRAMQAKGVDLVPTTRRSFQAFFRLPALRLATPNRVPQLARNDRVL